MSKNSGLHLNRQTKNSLYICMPCTFAFETKKCRGIEHDAAQGAKREGEYERCYFSLRLVLMIFSAFGMEDPGSISYETMLKSYIYFFLADCNNGRSISILKLVCYDSHVVFHQVD